LGCEEKSGRITPEQLFQHSAYLQHAFPEILARYAEVASKGGVCFEDFQNLYVGRKPERSSGVANEHNRFSAEELRALFDTIDAAGKGYIELSDVVANQELVNEKVPEMLAKWTEIDISDRGYIVWEEFQAFFGDVDSWLEFQLGEIVGLEELKNQIRRFYRGVVLDQLRRQRGHSVGSDSGKYHMIFQGNPGTGKTSLARLMAKLLHRVGIAPTGKLVEAQQEQLVAGFCGQTAPKTQKVIDEAVGGILFIDEAYRLSQGTGSNSDFGKEAIEQLMSAMNDPPSKAPIMVFAGYPAPMQQFMAQNDGLYRRIPYTFDFHNYSCSELAEILEHAVCRRGFVLERRLLENGRQELAGILEKYTLPESRALMNGGICERLFSLAKESLDLRDDPAQPSVLLSAGDVMFACQRLPPPPSSIDPSSSSSVASARSSGDARVLKDQMRQLQAENTDLRAEIEQLRREAGQGTVVDVFNATMMPASNHNPNSTSVVELQGLRTLLSEVRRLKAELQGRDERLEELERENSDLAERLAKAEESATARFPPGLPVKYFSASMNRWIDAIVEAFHDGKYDLDVKRGVDPDRVRRRGLEGGS
jgi:Ca2+-binding EF-hand superfamily protein/cell division protein FtsB